MFSNKLTAVKKREGGCSLVRRDFVVEVNATYTSGLLKCVANEGMHAYCCRRQW